MAFISVLLPALIQAGLGLVGGAASAAQTSSANQDQAEALLRQRRRLERLIDDIEDVDYRPVDNKFNREFSRAADALAAQGVAGGIAASGQQGLAEAAALGTALSELAQFKADDEMRRKNLIAQIRSDPSFSALTPEQFNPAMDAILGGLIGAVGGGAKAIGNQMSTPAGLAALTGLSGGGDDTRVESFEQNPLAFAFGGSSSNTSGSIPFPQSQGGGALPFFIDRN